MVLQTGQYNNGNDLKNNLADKPLDTRFAKQGINQINHWFDEMTSWLKATKYTFTCEIGCGKPPPQSNHRRCQFRAI